MHMEIWLALKVIIAEPMEQLLRRVRHIHSEILDPSYWPVEAGVEHVEVTLPVVVVTESLIHPGEHLESPAAEPRNSA